MEFPKRRGSAGGQRVLAIGAALSIFGLIIVALGFWYRQKIIIAQNTKTFIEANGAFATGVDLLMIYCSVLCLNLFSNALALVAFIQAFVQHPRLGKTMFGMICALVWLGSIISAIAFSGILGDGIR